LQETLEVEADVSVCSLLKAVRSGHSFLCLSFLLSACRVDSRRYGLRVNATERERERERERGAGIPMKGEEIV
jgi:hypothetical protein